MKRIVCTIVVFSFLISALGVAQNKNKFVGVNTCACHNLAKQGKQVDVWKKTKHAEAFTVLKTEKATEYAKAKNITGAPSEAKECLECHSTGFGQEVDKSFKVEMGVQCEACHGAASAYKAIHNKPENKEKAIAAGMLKADEKTCSQCHGENKMHDIKEFNFKKMWEEIKHPMPKG
ncbi:MAG: cytochrome c family protein [Bacteroidota bacterium]|nr:cytochrome c family protein [Bacteroidota bacterium]